MSPAGFETAIPVSGRPHTHTLDRAATGRDCNYLFVTVVVVVVVTIIIIQDFKVALFSSYVLFSPRFHSYMFHVIKEVVSI
jgi:hypothetical protein